MSGPSTPEGAAPGAPSPDAPPPEVPEEFAAAYREAYRRALEADDDAAAEAAAIDEIAPQEVIAVGSHRAEGEPPAGLSAGSTGLLASRWGLAALLLVLSAYGIGKLVSDEDPSDATAAPEKTAGTSSPSRSADRTPTASATRTTRHSGAWNGKVSPVEVDDAEASCTAPPSVDSAGNRVRYEARNTLDDDASSAWRCDGTAIGETLTFELPGDTELAEVGLIPGYAKTDRRSGADRYVENNRITRVRWTFGDGRSVVQKFDPDPENRAVQTVRVPRTETDEVTCEILEVRRGPRNTTAISEVVFGRAS